MRPRLNSLANRVILSASRAQTASAQPWISASAHVHPSASVSPGAIVMPHARVGARCVLQPGSVVGIGCQIGEGTVIGTHASIENCNIGAYCVLHGGVRIGADGFGFTYDEHGGVYKKPQLLRVLLGDGIELGANTCVDRGSWRDTVIGDETKVDNLVQIGHNVLIGRQCLICAHAALGGSSELGDRVIMGGKSAVSDHVKVCSNVRLAAKTGVIKDIEVSGDYGGYPALPAARWRRAVAIERRGSER